MDATATWPARVMAAKEAAMGTHQSFLVASRGATLGLASGLLVGAKASTEAKAATARTLNFMLNGFARYGGDWLLSTSRWLARRLMLGGVNETKRSPSAR